MVGLIAEGCDCKRKKKKKSEMQIPFSMLFFASCSTSLSLSNLEGITLFSCCCFSNKTLYCDVKASIRQSSTKVRKAPTGHGAKVMMSHKPRQPRKISQSEICLKTGTDFSTSASVLFSTNIKQTYGREDPHPSSSSCLQLPMPLSIR